MGMGKDYVWHLPLRVIIVDIFTGFLFSLKTPIQNVKIAALDSGCGDTYCQRCKAKQMWSINILIRLFPHIHLYCLGRGWTMWTYDKIISYKQACTRQVPLSPLWSHDISGCDKRQAIEIILLSNQLCVCTADSSTTAEVPLRGKDVVTRLIQTCKMEENKCATVQVKWHCRWRKVWRYRGGNEGQ